MENPRNVRSICGNCAPKPNPEFSEIPMEWFIGKYCKLGFEVPEESRGPSKEHMWVKVESCSNEKLHGVLDNNPLFVPNLSLKDKVSFTTDEIEDVMTPEDAPQN